MLVDDTGLRSVGFNPLCNYLTFVSREQLLHLRRTVIEAGIAHAVLMGLLTGEAQNDTPGDTMIPRALLLPWTVLSSGIHLIHAEGACVLQVIVLILHNCKRRVDEQIGCSRLAEDTDIGACVSLGHHSHGEPLAVQILRTHLHTVTCRESLC